MIRLTKGQSNDVIVTTTEKGSAAHYLFQFKNRTEMSNQYCVQQDTSAFTDRYNAFEITETSSPTATSGEVSLDAGEHEYFIYANSSSSNLDPTGLTLLERGLCVVTGTATLPTEHTNEEEYVEYQGN